MNSSSPARDSDLFAEFMGDVTPMAKPDTVSYFQRSSKPTLAQQEKRRAAEQAIQFDDNLLASEHVELLDPHDFLAFKKSGVQEGVYKNLRLGKYDVDATLDLHGQTLIQARKAMYETITDCHERNIRVLLIRHGIGEKSQPHRGLLKSYVNHWLQQLDCVLAFHSALKCHGGLGSTYALLKKSAQKKLENRELHAKR
ncbi:DNA endonuclease SmrA [Pseudoalteromonas sp. T1lg88]|uniref:DNA endonuclease SmrA n=1 Tax=Pseudoalteromonas sp. T1lg88 TaxID=2077104 RepID=UPI000CF70CD6|nr:DNA endonuclease SmrA [Pseudoalteromonas sp. T1lg88]